MFIAENIARQQAEQEQIQAQQDSMKELEQLRLQKLQQNLQNKLDYYDQQVDDLEAQIAELESSILELAKAGEIRGKQEMTFNLQVDGETIARASHKASEESAGRSFSPIPVY